MEKSQVNINNARKKEQRIVMERIIKDGLCPFCEKNLSKYHKKPILFKTKHWVVTENAWPYEMTKKHYLIISRNHIEHSSKISPTAWQEIGKIIQKLEKKYGLNYGTMLMRFGDSSKTGATVNHLHFQLIEPNTKSSNYNPKIGIVTRIG